MGWEGEWAVRINRGWEGQLEADHEWPKDHMKTLGLHPVDDEDCPMRESKSNL